MTELQKIRHSGAHLLAMAVLDLFPEAKFGTGPDTKDGFYYDFVLGRALTTEDLKIIEKKMKNFSKQAFKFEQFNMKTDEAIKFLKENNQDFKVEIAQDLKDAGETELSFYKSGNFTDMCAGPHVEHTGKVQHFKLTNISGAYFRGDSEKPMMQRIYGVCFETKEDLKNYENMLVEAKKRDHRVLGKKLGLFTFSDKVGAGLPMFTVKGTKIRNAIVREIQALQRKYGYGESDVSIPHITKKDLYEASGHWTKYKDDLFHVKGKSDTEFVMKPMNCPHHTQLFACEPRSYRDLPVRMTEVTTCYRDELAGELSGISRVRALTQDDGHVFCTVDQIKEEAGKIVNIIKDFYTKLGMFDEKNYWVSLSVRDPKTPEKYLGDTENWDKAEQYLKEVADENNLNYERIEGEAAFYGPKLDFMFKDAIGREWQLATIQCDFVQPERMDLKYTTENGGEERPVMIHRAIAGSLERFMALIIEHFAGALPLFLSPVHATIIPVAGVHEEYADKVFKKLKEEGFFVEFAGSHDSLGKRVRISETMKIPYSIIIGDKEVENKNITIRKYGTNGEQEEIGVDEFIEMIRF